MAVKPCGVTYFSPLRTGRGSVSTPSTMTGISLSEGIGEREGFYPLSHRSFARRHLLVRAHAAARGPAKSRNRLGFAVDGELATAEHDVADVLLAITLEITRVDTGARGRGAIGNLLDELHGHLDGEVRVELVDETEPARRLEILHGDADELDEALEHAFAFGRDEADAVERELGVVLQDLDGMLLHRFDERGFHRLRRAGHRRHGVRVAHRAENLLERFDAQPAQREVVVDFLDVETRALHGRALERARAHLRGNGREIVLRVRLDDVVRVLELEILRGVGALEGNFLDAERDVARVQIAYDSLAVAVDRQGIDHGGAVVTRDLQLRQLAVEVVRIEIAAVTHGELERLVAHLGIAVLRLDRAAFR